MHRTISVISHLTPRKVRAIYLETWLNDAAHLRDYGIGKCEFLFAIAISGLKMTFSIQSFLMVRISLELVAFFFAFYLPSQFGFDRDLLLMVLLFLVSFELRNAHRLLRLGVTGAAVQESLTVFIYLSYPYQFVSSWVGALVWLLLILDFAALIFCSVSFILWAVKDFKNSWILVTGTLFFLAQGLLRWAVLAHTPIGDGMQSGWVGDFYKWALFAQWKLFSVVPLFLILSLLGALWKIYCTAKREVVV